MQPSSATQPCLTGGATVYHDGANAGIRQYPLLYLVYNVCMHLFAPKSRKVRATWRAPVIGKRGKPLTPPWYTIKQAKAESEVHHLIGMALAQRVRLLPVWAQLSGARQEELARAIATMINGGTVDDFIPTLDFELFNGTLYDPLEIEAVERRLVWVQEQILMLKETVPRLRHRVRSASVRIEELQGQIDKVDAYIAHLKQEIGRREEWRQRFRNRYPDLFDNETGNLLKGNLLEFKIDWYEVEAGGEGPSDLQHEVYSPLRENVNQYDTYGSELDDFYRLGQEAQGERDQLASEQLDLWQAAARAEQAEIELEHYLLLQPVLEGELWRKKRESREKALEAQQEIQMEALEADFALQDANYTNQDVPQMLRALLWDKSGRGAIRRQIFLYLHPRLKYTWTAPTACRFVKLLACSEFLQAYDALNQRHLIQPGPFARLGVFVINALSPGSYDGRHRAMVQSELEQLVEAMHEYGMGETITCHSCGTDTFGDPDARGWIRDHNPPTALAKVDPVCWLLQAPLPFVQERQVLLPQCLECSTRQGVITSKVVAILNELKSSHQLSRIAAVVRDQVAERLESEEERADFARLILNPCGAWRNIEGLDLLEINWERLMTTGVVGSFAGIDEDLLKELGDTLGCHTCYEPFQKDPYRNISWIADHQPPTALVERGLMEMPQVVYPHCQRCSLDQARLVRALCRIFDGCFGDGFKDAWVEAIKEEGYNAL